MAELNFGYWQTLVICKNKAFEREGPDLNLYSVLNVLADTNRLL